MLDRSVRLVSSLHRAGSSFLKIGVTFAVLRMLGNIDVSTREIFSIKLTMKWVYLALIFE